MLRAIQNLHCPTDYYCPNIAAFVFLNTILYFETSRHSIYSKARLQYIACPALVSSKHSPNYLFYTYSTQKSKQPWLHCFTVVELPTYKAYKDCDT